MGQLRFLGMGLTVASPWETVRYRGAGQFGEGLFR